MTYRIRRNWISSACPDCGGVANGKLHTCIIHCERCGHAASMRRNDLKNRAHRRVARAVSRGQLAHPTTFKCTDCDIPAFCYDHRDYEKPLEVEPVCRGCNARRGPANQRLRVTLSLQLATA
jgi:hypothetical protein